MSYPKVCLNCDTPFEAKRDSARYCSEQCKNDWHTENRAASVDTLPQRVEGHVLDEVRGLLEEHKGDWTLIVREFARRTLFTTGYLSAADFTILGVPDEHCNLPGAQIGAFAGAGYMEAISFKRWSAEAKASRKSGKYWVYRITQKGKEHLSPLVGSTSCSSLGHSGHAAGRSGENNESVGVDVDHHGDGEGALSIGVDAPAVGVDPGAESGVGSPAVTKRDAVTSPPTVAADPGPSLDSLIQLDEAKAKPRNAIFDDDWETGEAA